MRSLEFVCFNFFVLSFTIWLNLTTNDANRSNEKRSTSLICLILGLKKSDLRQACQKPRLRKTNDGGRGTSIYYESSLDKNVVAFRGQRGTISI